MRCPRALYLLRLRGRLETTRWFLWITFLSFPTGFIAILTGWFTAEVGRQPWVVYGVFRTSSAITTASGLGATFAGFTLLYIGLSVVTVWAVRRVSTGSPDLSTSSSLRMA